MLLNIATGYLVFATIVMLIRLCVELIRTLLGWIRFVIARRQENKCLPFTRVIKTDYNTFDIRAG